MKSIAYVLEVVILILGLGLGSPIQAQPAQPPANVTGQASGLFRASTVICYNIARGQEVRGVTDVDGHFNCQTLGLTAQPGDTVQVSIAGTGDHLPITFFAQGIASLAFVSCLNRLTEDEIIYRGSAKTAFDCRGLPVNPGEQVTVRIRGIYHPQPVRCPCFDAARIANHMDVLASLPHHGLTGPRCDPEPDFAQWNNEDSIYSMPSLTFVASGVGTNRCNALFIDHNGQGLVYDVQHITPQEFQACHRLIVQHCPHP